MPWHERDVPRCAQSQPEGGAVGKQAGLYGNCCVDCGKLRAGTVLWLFLHAYAARGVFMPGESSFERARGDGDGD